MAKAVQPADALATPPDLNLGTACCGGWPSAIFPVLLIAWAFLLACVPLWTTDIWWHLRTGELILERGALPATDWFSFSAAGQPWIDLHWGFQMLVTVVYRLGGVDWLVLLKAVCLAAAVFCGWRASGRGLPAWARAGCWILPIVCISSRPFVRPEMLSLILLAVWVGLAEAMRDRPRLAWWLPLLQLVWVNCHGLFVLGLAVGAAFAVDRGVAALVRESSEMPAGSSRMGRKSLLAVAALVVLACFCNPYGVDGALFPVELYRKVSLDQAFYAETLGELQRPLDRWRRFGWANIYVPTALAVWTAAALSFVWLAREKRFDIMRLLLFAAFSHLAWQAIRNLSLFSLVAGIIVCRNCGEAYQLRAQRRRLPDETVVDASRLPRCIPAWLVAILLMALIVAQASGGWGRLTGTNFRPGLGEAEGWFIHDAARFAGRDGMPDRTFVAQMGQAAVFIYHNAPQRKVFIDARMEVAKRETLFMFREINQRMAHSNPTWQALLQDTQGNLPSVILDSRVSRRQIEGLLRMPGWRLVFADGAAAVFVHVPVAKRLNLPAVDPTPLQQPPGTKLRRDVP